MSSAMAQIKEKIPDYGRDIRLNLESVLSPEGSPGLTPRQIWGVALASSYALGYHDLYAGVLEDSLPTIDMQTIQAAKAAATIMGMNNVYYRSLHLLEDPGLKKLPARLRMNVIGNPGIPKDEFELMCFAVSALAGCGQCLTAHLSELRKAGVSDEGIQSSLKIASVLSGAMKALQFRDA